MISTTNTTINTTIKLPVKEQIFYKINKDLLNHRKVKELVCKSFDNVSNITDAMVYFDVCDLKFHTCFVTPNENLDANPFFIPAWFLELDDLLNIPLQDIFTDKELEKIINNYNSDINKFIEAKEIELEEIKKRQVKIITNNLLSNMKKIIETLQISIDRLYDNKNKLNYKLKFN